jgi:hypothetical protein
MIIEMTSKQVKNNGGVQSRFEVFALLCGLSSGSNIDKDTSRAVVMPKSSAGRVDHFSKLVAHVFDSPRSFGATLMKSKAKVALKTFKAAMRRAHPWLHVKHPKNFHRLMTSLNALPTTPTESKSGPELMLDDALLLVVRDGFDMEMVCCRSTERYSFLFNPHRCSWRVLQEARHGASPEQVVLVAAASYLQRTVAVFIARWRRKQHALRNKLEAHFVEFDAMLHGAAADGVFSFDDFSAMVAGTGNHLDSREILVLFHAWHEAVQAQLKMPQKRSSALVATIEGLRNNESDVSSDDSDSDEDATNARHHAQQSEDQPEVRVSSNEHGKQKRKTPMQRTTRAKAQTSRAKTKTPVPRTTRAEAQTSRSRHNQNC